MRRLLRDGVPTRRGVMAIHEEPAYADVASSLPHTEAATRDSLMLPLFAGLTDEQQDHVIDSPRDPVAAVGGVTPEPLLVVGGGGFARETLELVDAINRVARAGACSGSWTTTRAARRRVHGTSRSIGPAAAGARAARRAGSAPAWPRPGNPPAGWRSSRGSDSIPERYATARAPGRGRARGRRSIGPGSVLHAGDRRSPPT